MSELAIEPAFETEIGCPCCSGPAPTYGFVLADGAPYAIYCAEPLGAWPGGDGGAGGLRLGIAIGRWDAASTAADRRAAAFVARRGATRPSLAPSDTHPDWTAVAAVATRLSAAEAAADAGAAEFRRVAERALADDPRLAAITAGTPMPRRFTADAVWPGGA